MVSDVIEDPPAEAEKLNKPALEHQSPVTTLDVPQDDLHYDGGSDVLPISLPRTPSAASLVDLSHGSSPRGGPSLNDVGMVVDIGQNQGRWEVMYPGRESHTSDLAAFDQYLDRLRNLPRPVDEDEEDEDEVELEGGRSAEDDNEDCGGEEGGGSGDDPTSRKRCPAKSSHPPPPSPPRPICERLWSHVRSVLEKATPVGFSELSDPDAILPKTKSDATAFLMKAVGISSVNPINPRALAEAAGVSHRECLDELLYATQLGLVGMRWCPECVRCGSVVTEAERIGDLPAHADCAGCHEPNDIDNVDRIQVLFHLSRDVLYVLMENYACTPSSKSMAANEIFATVPATSTGSGFRYDVGCGDLDHQLRPALEPGRYRMHCPVAKTDNYLRVERRARDDDEPVTLRVHVSDLVFNPDVGMERRELSVPHGRIHMDVYPDTRSFFVLWVQKDLDDDTLMRLPPNERVPYTSASDVMHVRTFQRLFANQVVSSRPESLLRIERVVLVFTDVVGSTNLYASHGDGAALALVRRHYEILFHAFTRRGRVVKTVGDAVMASFVTGRDALEACARALRGVPSKCIKMDGSPLEIRVGVHCGPAVVVSLNGVNDYFGQTVNVAARVEGAAKASECFVTEAVLDSDPDARAAYDELVSSKPGRNGGMRQSSFAPTPVTKLSLKGVSEPVKARGLRLRPTRGRRWSNCEDGDDGDLAPVRHTRRSQMYERNSVTTQDSTLSSGDEGQN